MRQACFCLEVLKRARALLSGKVAFGRAGLPALVLLIKTDKKTGLGGGRFQVGFFFRGEEKPFGKRIMLSSV